MIPNEYLYYFYYGADTVDAMRRARRAARSCSSSRRAFYARNGQTRRRRWPTGAPPAHERERTLHGRGARRRGRRRTSTTTDDGGGYEGEAMAVVEAIAQQHPRGADPQHRQPLARCRSSTSARSSRCRASSAAPARVPLAVGDVPAHARALIETIKDVERTTIEAALLGSRELAVQALALHPLVPSVTTAREIFDGYRAAAARAAGALRA